METRRASLVALGPRFPWSSAQVWVKPAPTNRIRCPAEILSTIYFIDHIIEGRFIDEAPASYQIVCGDKVHIGPSLSLLPDHIFPSFDTRPSSHSSLCTTVILHLLYYPCSKPKVSSSILVAYHGLTQENQISHSNASSAFSPLVYRAGIAGDFQRPCVCTACRGAPRLVILIAKPTRPECPE